MTSGTSLEIAYLYVTPLTVFVYESSPVRVRSRPLMVTPDVPSVNIAARTSAVSFSTDTADALLLFRITVSPSSGTPLLHVSALHAPPLAGTSSDVVFANIEPGISSAAETTAAHHTTPATMSFLFMFVSSSDLY